MENRSTPSLVNRILTPSLFLAGGFAAVSWFIYKIYLLIININDHVVLIDKGAYYLFGVGLGMLALAFIIIWEQWLIKPLNKKITTAFSKLAILSVVLLFALPQLIHYVADEYLKNKKYIICEEASHQWLLFRQVVYIHETIECDAGLKKG